MRKGTWDRQLQGHHGRNRLKARHKGARRPRLHLAELENLESRTLLATLPAAAAVGGPQNISSLFGNAGGLTANETSSLVAVDPLDPTKLVSVWVDDDPALLGITDNVIQGVLEGAYSINSGQSWIPFLGEPANGNGIPVDPELFDPTTSGPTVGYKFVTDPSLGFDDSGNFYILAEYQNATTAARSSSGALVLQKYGFTGSAPSAQAFGSNEQTPNPYGGGGGGGFGGTADLKVLYQWDSSGSNDTALDPTMTVDDNLATIPTGVTSLPDPNSGNIYVTWASVDVKPTLENAGVFNPNRIKVEVSSDGGDNFSPLAIAGNNNDLPDPTVPGEKDTTPVLTVAQGRSGVDNSEGNESGQAGDVGIPGGQVAVTFDDFGNNQVVANTISPGDDYSFDAQYSISSGSIPFGTYLSGGTAFPVTVSSISNPTQLDTLDVTVNIVDSSDANLGLELQAPSGDTFELLANQVIDTNPTTTVTNTGQGISGSNLGVVTYTTNNIASYAMGTTFDDNATRDIFDPTATGTNSIAAPAIGAYRPEGAGFGGFGGETLDQFLAAELKTTQGINGTWHLITLDSNTSAPSSPNFIINWSLSLGRGLTPDNNRVVVPATKGLVVPGSITGTFTTASAASPIGMGPGLVMAEDNTIGGYSPYEGRIYASFVGYFNVTNFGVKNPTDNTDIFLTYSDDGGRSWSDPTQVDDDEAIVDGNSESNSLAAAEVNGDEVTGREQFQPAIAVDPVTGTLVMSWRAGRTHPSRSLVATYITTSIDGGNTFSPQVYANPSETAVDAITGQTDVLGPEADNEASSDTNKDTNYGYGTSMGLAVYDGQVYPVWAGNFNLATVVNGVIQSPPLSTMFQPMVIAAGPRIVDSTMGPIPLAEAESGNVSFTVTFDRPINPPGIAASFTPADIQVFYRDAAGDPSISLDVLPVTPVAASGVGPDNKFGYTEFTVAFDPAKVAGGASGSGITNYTGTYSYLVTPDDEAGHPIESMIPSYVNTQVPQAVIRAGPVGDRGPADPHLGDGRVGDGRRSHDLDDRCPGPRQPGHHGDHGQPDADASERQRPVYHPDGPQRPDRGGLPGHVQRPGDVQQPGVQCQRPGRRPRLRPDGRDLRIHADHRRYGGQQHRPVG